MAIHPSIVMPTHYTGEPNHVSDTEQTTLIDLDQFELKIQNDNQDESSDQQMKEEIIDENLSMKHHIDL